jgi:hypothetical protein
MKRRKAVGLQNRGLQVRVLPAPKAKPLQRHGSRFPVDATSYLKLGHVAELRLGLVATEERHIVGAAACWKACTRNEKTMSLMPRMMAKAATQAMSRTALRP